MSSSSAASASAILSTSASACACSSGVSSRSWSWSSCPSWSWSCRRGRGRRARRPVRRLPRPSASASVRPSQSPLVAFAAGAFLVAPPVFLAGAALVVSSPGPWPRLSPWPWRWTWRGPWPSLFRRLWPISRASWRPISWWVRGSSPCSFAHGERLSWSGHRRRPLTGEPGRVSRSDPGAEGATTPRNLSGTRTVGARQLWSSATEGESGRARPAPTTRNERSPAMPDQLATDDPGAGRVRRPAHRPPRRRPGGDARHARATARSTSSSTPRCPSVIREAAPLALPEPLSETDALARLRELAARNEVFTSLIGLGYHDTITPPVILRNVLENPAWYTAYTPYQPEISQGRLEALLNFQTMVSDLTGMDLANASLLDEGTAAAEAMAMLHRAQPEGGAWSSSSTPTRTRRRSTSCRRARSRSGSKSSSAIPTTRRDGDRRLLRRVRAVPGEQRSAARSRARRSSASTRNGALVCVAADLLALALVTPPGEMGADVVVGTTQRFGVPLGFGGPHAAYLAVRDEHRRTLPGRLVGVSIDAQGRTAFRLALQTREQHIRREKATSNICTAQVLLAVIAGLYAVVPRRRRPARDRAAGARARRSVSRRRCARGGVEVVHEHFFDTLTVRVPGRAAAIVAAAAARRINLRLVDADTLGIALDETTTTAIVDAVLAAFGIAARRGAAGATDAIPPTLVRTSEFLTHPAFTSHRSEHQMLRYLRRLADRDLALDRTMIPLGSCTMKLNATAEMEPITWPEFGRMHPYAPLDQAQGYLELFDDLERWLAEITGYDAVSLQPNAGSQGEYAGLLAIRKYHVVPRRLGPRRVPHSRVGARHQRGVGRDGRDEGGRGRVRRPRQRRPRRPEGEGGRARRRPGRADGDLPVDARRVRGADPRDLRGRARAGRAGVPRRREPQRARRRRAAGQVRRRRLAPQPAQDVLHPARRRRSRRRPDRRARAPRAVPAEQPAARRGRARPRASARSAPRRGVRPASCRSRGCTCR